MPRGPAGNLPRARARGSFAARGSRRVSPFGPRAPSPTVIARTFACFLLLLGAARGAIDAVDALPLAEDRVLRTWEIADGLRDNHISGVARDADGYLWLTNFSGLLRFDGVRFVHMDAERLPGLPTPWVAPVFVSDSGALWLGLERGGAARWSNGKLDTPAPVRPRPTDEVWPWSFAEDATGAVWMGAAHTARVTRFAGGERREFGVAEGLPGGHPTVVRVTADGTPWVATSEGCAIWDGGGRFRAVDPAAGGGWRPALAAARGGGMWALRGGRLIRHGPGGERLETLAPEWLSRVGQVNALHEDAEGALWIGTRDVGLLRFRGGVFERVPTSFADVSWLSEDRDGNLWVGTWGGGLDRLSARRFFLRAAEAGRPGQALYSICEDTEGRLWAIGRRAEPLRSVATGAGRGADGEVDGVGGGGREGDAAFAPVAGWPAGQGANVVCADPEGGGVWLGTSTGVLRWRDGVVAAFELGERVVSLLVGADRGLWIGTEAGALWRLHEGRLTAQAGPRAVRALAEDGRGRLWVGDQTGGVFVREAEAARAGGRGGFVPVALPGAGAEETVRFVVADGEDSVWIGTLLGGLYRWREGRVARVPELANRMLAEVRSLLIEPRSGGPRAEQNAADVFWLGTATGLWRTTRGELEDYIDGRRTSSPLTLCGANEGLPTLEFVARGQNASVRTRDGRLCFATNRGWLEIPPGTAVEPAGEARVLIEEASVSLGSGAAAGSDAGADAGEEAEASAGRRRYFFTGGAPGAVEFPARPEAVSIRYTLPELGGPERVRFRYRVGGGGAGGAGVAEAFGENADAGWIEAGAQREATIVRPEPGNYRFEVAARVGDGPWSRAAAVLDFSVRAAWWQTVWFRGGAVLVLAAGLGAAVRAWATRRMRAKIRRLEQERVIERERARIARDMHDELGADLTLITSMARAAEAEPATDPRQMGDLSEIARRTVESLDAIVWAVNPRNDSLAGTVEFVGKFAAGFLAKAGIEAELVWPESVGIPSRPVSAEPRHHLFLAIKESLANIVKHSGARRVRMEMRAEAARLTILIEDDGRGFAPGAGDRFSDGFANMRRRMAEVGGDCRVEGRAGAGCRVVFELPLRDGPPEAGAADPAPGDSA